MYVLLASLLSLGAIGHAADFVVRGDGGPFALDASFREVPNRDPGKGHSFEPLDFKFSYDPHALGHFSIEHQYLRSIFGGRAFTLTQDDVQTRGIRKITADAHGTTGTYLVLCVEDHRVLNGYYALGIEIGTDGRPLQRANVVIFEGDLSRWQSVLQAMLVGRHQRYLRPILRCEAALNEPT